MKRNLLIPAGLALAVCVAFGSGARESAGQQTGVAPRDPASASPERELVGIKLGRSFLDVTGMYGQPDEIHTVSVLTTPGQAPGAGAFGAGAGDAGIPGFAGGGMFGGGDTPMMGGPSGAPGMMGSGGSGGMFGGGPMAMGGRGAPGMMGSGGSGGLFGGGGPMAMGGGRRGGFMGAPGGSAMGGGPGALPPGDAGAFPGMMGSGGGGMFGPGGGGMFGGGDSGAGMGATPAGPEYSSALLWVYKRSNARLEFLINEDGRVAQSSVASPADKVITSVYSRRGKMPVRTARGITLGSRYGDVVSKYNFPERTRQIPGGRFIESYYTRDYHAAFTTDALKGLKVVRITVTLAD